MLKWTQNELYHWVTKYNVCIVRQLYYSEASMLIIPSVNQNYDEDDNDSKIYWGK